MFMGIFGSSDIKITDPDLRNLQKIAEEGQKTLNSIMAQQAELLKERQTLSYGNPGLTQEEQVKIVEKLNNLFKILNAELNKEIANFEKRKHSLPH